MADIKLGDRIRARISYGMEGGGTLPTEEGTVVYIHPEGRFFTLEFTFPNRYGGVQKFREAYIMDPPPERIAPPPGALPFSHGRHHNMEARASLGRYLATL